MKKRRDWWTWVIVGGIVLVILAVWLGIMGAIAWGLHALGAPWWVAVTVALVLSALGGSKTVHLKTE